ncbi:MAG: hypothetical protein JSS83_02185 [Cyanobacteria bacterium SZAS LIN-3]|nr:hypothetical protein [Cyanobacteria bacterium SZAS LIN-3]
MAREPERWFVSPLVDVLFVCGGAVFLLAAGYSFCLTQSAGSHQLGYLSAVAVASVLIFGETHTVATMVGPARDSVWGQRHRAAGFAAAAVSMLLVLVLLALPTLAPLAVRLYLLAVSWHFTRQVYGVILLYCRKADYHPGAARRRLWCLLFHLTALNWMLVQLSNYFNIRSEVLFLQNLTPLHILPVAAVDFCSAFVIALLLVTFADAALLTMFRRARPPFAAMLTLLAVCLFFLPVGPSRWFQGPIWLYAPALFHGSQYLCVMGWRLAAGARSGEQVGLLAGSYLRCFVLALLLFLALPWLLHALMPAVAYATALVAVFVSAQLYHMVMDSVIWKGEKKTAATSGGLKLRVGHAGGAVMDLAV